MSLIVIYIHIWRFRYLVDPQGKPLFSQQPQRVLRNFFVAFKQRRKSFPSKGLKIITITLYFQLNHFVSTVPCKTLDKSFSTLQRLIQHNNLMFPFPKHKVNSFTTKTLPAEDGIVDGVRLNKFLRDAVQGMRRNVGNSEVGTEVVFYFPLRFSV